MKFEKYDPIKEKGSCVLRTFTKLLEKEPNAIKEELINIAKKHNYENYNEIEVFEEYLYKNNYKKINNYNNSMIKDIELGKGKYAIFCYDKEDYYHMIPVIDNTVYDKTSSCFNLYIISIYKLK